MILWFLVFGTVFSAPTDEFGQFSKDDLGDAILHNQDKFTRNIVPGISNHKSQEPKIDDGVLKLPFLYRYDEESELVKNVNYHLKKGSASKGLIFNIYDDDMREAAIALFRLFQAVNNEDIDILKSWGEQNINKEMLLYVIRLDSLFSPKPIYVYPPFIWNPHYFVNSETIVKALEIMNTVRAFERIDPQLVKIDQYAYHYHRKPEEFISINTNYSGWYLPMNGIDGEINYFREDISLNSYYLGIHLLHPFWMPNEELDVFNPRHTEHYYYAHQQLMARYLLEKEHLDRNNSDQPRDEADYVPSLMYRNGLPFPTRSCIKRNWDDEQALLKTIDIAIRECIARGILIMENGTTISMTEDNHIDILARLIRANLDNVNTAKIIRSVFGYGGNKMPIDKYNPAPSLLHHPETSLRDPVYWYLIQYMLNYFTEFKENMTPYDLSVHETDDIIIAESQFSKITTYFNNYQFPINYATSIKVRNVTDWPVYITARQRRLVHKEFFLNFTVESATDVDVVVRLFLGPLCGGSNCWDQYSRFFELDNFVYELKEGINVVPWSPDASNTLSSDYYYNSIFYKRIPDYSYSMFKFPDHLIVPQGLEQGLNLTLFVMMTKTDVDTKHFPPNYYSHIIKELDEKPLGFPFHRKATGINEDANNYKFFNISIFHKKLPVDDDKGYFSPHLY